MICGACGMELIRSGDVWLCPTCKPPYPSRADWIACYDRPDGTPGRLPPEGVPVDKPGEEALWQWFGLSYATFLTMPRVLMHAMPDDWQADVARLLEQYDEAFPNRPDIGSSVRITRNGRCIPTPEWIKNYRHPDKAAIDNMRTRT